MSRSTKHQAHQVPCHRCGVAVTPLRPGWRPRLAEALAIAASCGLFTFIGVFAPVTLTFLAPVLLSCGFMVVPLHEAAWAEPSCPRCGGGLELPGA